MTEPAYLAAVRESYDTVAATYADQIDDRFAKMPAIELAFIAEFAELAAGGGPVADIGCGPGRTTAHLVELGLPAFGVDLSPGMIEQARRTYPDLRFTVGSMTALDLPDSTLGGILAWYSTYHTPVDLLPAVFAEFHRTLAPGGHLLLGGHAGDEHIRSQQAYGHPVRWSAFLVPPDRTAALLAGAGLTITARLVRDPTDPEKRQQACFLARKPPLTATVAS